MRYDDLAERLQSIAEELDERAFEMLRNAVADGELRRPDSDKLVTQARRAVEKAVTLLRRADGSGGDGVDRVDEQA